ncbi:MAG TPA: hydroxymethylglutaryl-CoA reductase [Stellaceae bacterium]|nr:hydroxymethylglutaryl-CoA reductase [Stellaceae bacterium]
MIVPPQILWMLERLRATITERDVTERLKRRDAGLPAPLRPIRHATAETLDGLWLRLGAGNLAAERAAIADPDSVRDAEIYSANIENFIGTVKVPVGVIGPVRVNGLHAHGDYFIPMATTEAALVASYGRGAEVVSRAGGASVALLGEGVLRSPGFLFEGLVQSGLFVEWVARTVDDLKRTAEATTRYGKLVSLEPVIDNDIVFLLCRYTTGDASGQNMVTIATEALCRFIEANSPVKPRRWFVEANFSGDKKASHLGMLTGRGRKASASVVVPADIVRSLLHTDIDAMLEYGRVANLGALLAGQLGAQAHYANGLAAFYIATGQDAACVSESAVGFTRMEARDGGLFVSATLPNILVGSVGGGTGLPSQSAALRIMGLAGDGKAAALAELVAVLCLCGEISIVAALAAGHFARAHRKLARLRKPR